MRVVGVDFTSAPKRGKSIVVAECSLGSELVLDRFLNFSDWPAYELWLGSRVKWIGGFDFPFGLPKRFVDRQGWPNVWPEMVKACIGEGKERFVVDGMRAFKAARSDRDKHRQTDMRAGSHSPLKTNTNPPVGRMFYEGAWRLLSHGIHIPVLNETGSTKIAVEAYPGFLAKQMGFRQYKNDKPGNSRKNRQARRDIVRALQSGGHPLKIRLALAPSLGSRAISDASGDSLDAILCAVQAAWAAQRPNYGLPPSFHRCEGWIVSA